MAIEGFAGTLRKLRKERNLTQKQLADAVSLSQRQISLLESDKEVPRAETIERLRNFFHLDVDTWKYFKQSQIEFAKELGISQSAMSAIEKDASTPSYEILCTLGKMGFHLNWILYGESDSLPPRAILDHVAGSHELQKINKILEELPPDKPTAVRKAMELLLRS